MIIPLGTERSLVRKPIVTISIVTLTIGVHLSVFMLSMFDSQLADRIVETFCVQGGFRFRWWGLLTSAFLHAGWLHLAGNMLFLWVFGPSVEDRYGHLGFLAFYLAGAAASGGAHALVEVQPFAIAGGQTMLVGVPAIGASGAIAAVTGAFLVMFPNTRVRVLWLIGLSVVFAPAWWLIGLGVAWNLFAVGVGDQQNIAYIAHLAGYGFGFVVAMGLLAARVVPRDSADLLTMIRHAQRRRQFRVAATPEAVVPRPVRAATMPPDETIDAVAEARAEVSRLIASKDFEGAAKAYQAMESQFAHRPEMLSLSRNAHATLAAHLYSSGRYRLAGSAIERFVASYPNDREADHMRILLARLYREKLGRASEATTLLEEIIATTQDAEVRTLASSELPHSHQEHTS